MKSFWDDDLEERQQEEEATRPNDWIELKWEDEADDCEREANDLEACAAAGTVHRSEETPKWVLTRPVTPSEIASRGERYRQMASELRARAAELRVKAADSRASWKALFSKKDEKRALPKTISSDADDEIRKQSRRHTRYGKPDARFVRGGGSEVQRITGEETLIRVIVRPDASTSTTFGRPTPLWLEKSEPGAVIYDVWARNKKHARLLVKLNVRANGPHMPGIRRETHVPTP